MTDDIETTPTETTTDGVVESTGGAKKKSKAGLWAIGIVILAVLVFVAWRTLGPATQTTVEQTASTNPAAVVATVDGQTITRAELDKKMQQVRSTIPAGSADPTADAGFELQLLDELVNLKLLDATAQAKGMSVTDAEVDKELSTLIDSFGGEDAFQKQLQATGLTRDELRDNMRNELLIQKLVNAETNVKDVTVSDEEIATAYTAAISSAPEGQDIPPLDQVKEMIRSQLLQQKSSAIVQEYIDKLRATADINVTL
jgi:hypothetical protein